MNKLPRLNFPHFSFKITTSADVCSVWDAVRRGWYVLTPEEWVRQHVVRYFVEYQGVPQTLIVHEYAVTVQAQAQRADLVIFSPELKPLLLVECKATTVAIDNVTLAQAVRYNAVVGARYIMLTNGLRHYCYEQNGAGEYVKLTTLPLLSDAFSAIS